MTKKTIVILGATGKQGGSVVKAFMHDPSFAVRAVTRDARSAAAKALSDKGVEVVEADTMDEASLVKAFKGANIIYAVTADIGVNLPTLLKENHPTPLLEAYRREQVQVRNLVHAAETILDTSLELFIFSGLSAAKRLSGGEFRKIYHFDAKAEMVEYLEARNPRLAERTAVLQLGMFLTNTRAPSPLRATKQAGGRYRILMPCSIDTPVPFIDPIVDPAMFFKALATQPLPPPLLPDTKVRQFAGYSTMTTFAQWTTWLNQHLPLAEGEEVYFEETSIEDWSAHVAALPEFGVELAEMWKYCEKVGYFGGDKGGARIITDLKLEGSPVKAEDWIKAQGRSLLFE